MHFPVTQWVHSETLGAAWQTEHQEASDNNSFIYHAVSWISSNDQQSVSDTAIVFLYHAISLYFIPWPTVCKWHCTYSSVSCSLITFHPMTNRGSVTMHLFFFTMQSNGIDQQYVSDTVFVFLYHAASLHFIPWPTVCKWHYICFSPPCSISSYYQQSVRFFLCHAVWLHFIPWPTGSEWYCICFLYHAISLHSMTNRMWVTVHLFFFTMQSHGISSHEQQVVRLFFSLPCSLICISSDDHWQRVSDHAFVFLTMQSHSISFYCDQQPVSDLNLFLYHAVSLHFIPLWPKVCEWHCICFFLYHAVSLCFIPWPTVGEWQCICLYLPWSLMHFIPLPTASEWQCICFSLLCSLIAFDPITNRTWVTVHFVSLLCSLIAFYPMTNRMWATAFVFLYCAVSLHFIPWPTGGEWQHICFFLPCSHAAFHPMTNSMWVTVHLFFFIMQSHCIPSHGQ